MSASSTPKSQMMKTLTTTPKAPRKPRQPKKPVEPHPYEALVGKYLNYDWVNDFDFPFRKEKRSVMIVKYVKIPRRQIHCIETLDCQQWSKTSHSKEDSGYKYWDKLYFDERRNKYKVGRMYDSYKITITDTPTFIVYDPESFENKKKRLILALEKDRVIENRKYIFAMQEDRIRHYQSLIDSTDNTNNNKKKRAADANPLVDDDADNILEKKRRIENKVDV